MKLRSAATALTGVLLLAGSLVAADSGNWECRTLTGGLWDCQGRIDRGAGALPPGEPDPTGTAPPPHEETETGPPGTTGTPPPAPPLEEPVMTAPPTSAAETDAPVAAPPPAPGTPTGSLAPEEPVREIPATHTVAADVPVAAPSPAPGTPTDRLAPEEPVPEIPATHTVAADAPVAAPPPATATPTGTLSAEKPARETPPAEDDDTPATPVSTRPPDEEPPPPPSSPPTATEPAETAEMPAGEFPANERSETPTEPASVPDATDLTGTTESGQPAAQPAAASPLVPMGALSEPESRVSGDNHEDRWRLCPPATPEPRFDADALAAQDQKIRLSADSATASDEGLYTLEGNAVLTQGAQQLRADTITLDETRGLVEAEGDLRFLSDDLTVRGNRARLFPEQNKGNLYDIEYTLPARHARGKAKVVQLKDRHRQRLEKATFTTCPPGDTDWKLVAREVKLDHEEGMGEARNAKIRFQDVPILYTPYITFPIDDRRRSGLLLPKAGTTQETGFDISVPYYWNIAPNYDATLRPRYMSKRGFMMGGEFRYLHRKNRGTLKGEYLPSDNEFEDRDRHLVSMTHNGNPFPRLETEIIASDVSDKDYFSDLGDSLIGSSLTHLRREANTTYHGNRWTLDTRVLDFQTIDPSIPSDDKPYKQLPRIRLNATPEQRLLGMRFGLQSELTEFDRDESIKGTRIDLQPRITLPLRKAGYYIKPSASLRYTRYKLSNVPGGETDNPDRTTPVISLDAGTFFDRNIRWGNSDYVQSLEPRLHYLFVPNRNQDDIPVFDTGNYDFNYWTLFQENRFSGPDRMGDANQLAVALTTRVLNPATGVQQLRASIGELFYFRNRKVSLPGEPVENDSNSDIIGELKVAFGSNWYANTEIQWNPHETHTNRYDFLLQYKASSLQLINLSYRYRRSVLEQADISFIWPLGRYWHAVGRWNYSIDDNRALETLAGIGYESCCWGARLVGRSFVNGEEGNRTNGVFLELELKGLASIGHDIDNLLDRGILAHETSY